ncbi:hypothetical protein [Hymenobacter yonginensis]|uniref:MoxR-vWA-beta-propeller ternary system domain-containing protein n=1 Tax=Hymenobacter yonginensis TaxID=748197 RepID=A0ABY7PVD5_9BACT|nr:hypothetical protein [Hymenobacter yonginensis]WBO86875.1 hypothetical protein O9Z63_20550 [Hymenobacter yonginensis]
MLLTLSYHETAQRPASAAFLRGSDPAAWLRELSRWNLPIHQLACYLVPESIRSVQVAGLFVVAAAPLPADVLEPYGAEADGRLFVPVQATLWPATAPDELAAALLWPRQLLHPSIGLVGFDTEDELSLVTLLDCTAPRATDWSRARPGIVPKPRLQQVRVLAPTVAEVLESFQSDVGTVPLAQLPGLAKNQPGSVRKAFNSLRHRLLTAVLAMIRWLPGLPAAPVVGVLGMVLLVVMAFALLASVVSQLGQGSLGGLIVPLTLLIVRIWRSFSNKDANQTIPTRPVTSARPGIFQRLENWLGGRIDNLEQKRQNEIERLLRLFSENTEEALKYAIPLGGPYQDRGTAPQSARLGLRSTNFNLGGLGGGGRVDTWNLDAYRHNLGLQYGAAATREIAAGRFKKAAYIYAHLLGDYQNAANALEQGGFYREAAALHKDHLRNLPAAAKCLEHGGLLLEAAEIYTELREHEKAGDLYQLLGQTELAARHYERGVSLFLGNQDHPAAARLLADKLADACRAQTVLLDGWASSKQPEVCLRQYFDVLAAQSAANLSAHVQQVFQQHTSAAQRIPLLQVLATVNEKHPAPELLTASRDIAYEVVGTEATAGNMAYLPLLRHFLPDDRLISADCSRFASRQPPRPLATSKLLSSSSAPQLDATIEWISAVTHGHQWVAIGTRDNRLHLARGNWYGHVEYHSWLADMSGVYVLLIADEQHGNTILLRTSEAVVLETKRLPRNKYFSVALTVECPSWLPPWPARVCLLPGGMTATAHLQAATITVQRYLAGGQGLPPFYAQLAVSIDAGEQEWPDELLYRDGYYYSCWGNYAVRWAEKGISQVHEVAEDSQAFQMAWSSYTPKLQLAVFTPFNLLLWEPHQRISKEPLPVYSPNFMVTGDMQFVSAEHLVMLDDSTAVLLRMQEQRYEQIRLIELEHIPVAVLRTINRQQFALLETTGRITLHQIGDE